VEYRIVRDRSKPNHFLIYDEANSELKGKASFGRKGVIFRRFTISYEENTVEIRNGLFARRKWKLGSTIISVRSKMLGRRVSIQRNNQKFSAKGFERGKMEITDVDGRTGLILDNSVFKSEDMVLLQHFDRFDLLTSLIASIIVLDTYGIW
jgi:hypothetical protein